jgi:hypothetical protein
VRITRTPTERSNWDISGGARSSRVVRAVGNPDHGRGGGIAGSYIYASPALGENFRFCRYDDVPLVATERTEVDDLHSPQQDHRANVRASILGDLAARWVGDQLTLGDLRWSGLVRNYPPIWTAMTSGAFVTTVAQIRLFGSLVAIADAPSAAVA